MTNSSAPTEQRRGRAARLQHALDVANTRVGRMCEVIKRLQEENAQLRAANAVLRDAVVDAEQRL